jgi:epoxyqueuosine reductase QueG
VVCPLVARDAGLGEIGRMGLLMTPRLGPRVRIAVVTTDLPLEADERRPEPSTLDFCTRCRKCADVCPSRAIPLDDRASIDGARRWRIDSEACFTYWCQVGTDCARCVKVCPYSHPDNALHNAVRWGLRNSSPFRRLALAADDLFYGKKPPPATPPTWINGARS